MFKKSGKVVKTTVKSRVKEIVKDDAVSVGLMNRLSVTLVIVGNEARHDAHSKILLIPRGKRDYNESLEKKFTKIS